MEVIQFLQPLHLPAAATEPASISPLAAALAALVAALAVHQPAFIAAVRATPLQQAHRKETMAAAMEPLQAHTRLPVAAAQARRVLMVLEAKMARAALALRQPFLALLLFTRAAVAAGMARRAGRRAQAVRVAAARVGLRELLPLA
jgi:hypothetical protein